MDHDKQENTLLRFVSHQLESFFPLFGEKCLIDIHIISAALRRTHVCINQIKEASNGFEYLNSRHYATFLYFLSRECVCRNSGLNDAKRVFLLNKALNGIDLFYEIQMPNVFVLGHTVGMVFAKASYGSRCVFHQGCTVGRNGIDRPVLEPGVILFPNSSVIGRCLVRENTVLAPGVQLVNQDTPGNCYVFAGEKGRPVFKEISEYYSDRFLDRTLAAESNF